MRVIGIDPGTVSIDMCGIDDGAVFLDASVATGEALADPAGFVASLAAHGPLDLVAGPSGYGLPLARDADLTDDAIRLALLAAPGEDGGIGGLGALLRALAASALPVVFTPGAIHLPTVPPHRKVNRVDLGTADKVCAAALALREQAARRGIRLHETSFLLVELGGAFTAVLAVDGGRIVNGAGGSSGPIGLRAAGALDGEVAFLAGRVTKPLLFTGGVATIADVAPDDGEAALAAPSTARAILARDAYLDGVQQTVAGLGSMIAPPFEIVLSGRLARSAAIVAAVTSRLAQIAPVCRLEGFAHHAKHAAQGAALIADGLAGGAHRDLVDSLALRAATGTALDHLHVISPARARERLGL